MLGLLSLNTHKAGFESRIVPAAVPQTGFHTPDVNTAFDQRCWECCTAIRYGILGTSASSHLCYRKYKIGVERPG